jgi:16S rRNA C967 or C1407 C5-methylase (RsmB/RsmF family)/NOL1/NOP2/fmu family ribosome biogenesis protein
MKSLPQAFEEQMTLQLRNNFEAFAEALQKSSPTSIRLNPKKNSDTLQHPVPWTRFGHYLQQRPVFTLDPALHGGKYYVQEASSMFLEHALKQAVDLNQSIRVLDLCAAPGGKSTHLLSLISDNSFLISNEVIRSRASILSENIQKWGYPNCLVTNNDPKDFSELDGFFDLIVVDAPCSGEGLFRKDPQAMNEWSPENVELCAARQKRILHDIWPALKENGVLIYCTCTYNPAENEDNLNTFANEYDVSFVDLAPRPEWNIEVINAGKVIGYRFFPHRVNGEGFFISALRKNEATKNFKGKNKTKLQFASKKISETALPWIRATQPLSIIQHNDLLFALPENGVLCLEHVLPQLKLVYAGTNLATVKHDKLVPEHSFAVSNILQQESFQCLDVDEKTAVSYLRKETVAFDGYEKGFSIVRYQNLPIGWVNVLQNRANNMYPAEWRIRMAPL